MTIEQRRQAIDFGKIRGTGMPRPIGMSSANNRSHILNIYYEIPAPPSPVYTWVNRSKVQNAGWNSKTTPTSPWVTRAGVGSIWVERVPSPDSKTLAED